MTLLGATLLIVVFGAIYLIANDFSKIDQELK